MSTTVYGVASPDRDRIAQLRAEIARHDQSYYVNHRPTIDDFAFDKLCRELNQLETAAGIPHSRVVGSDLSAGFKKVKHAVAMLSLDNVFSAEEAIRYIGHEGRLVVEPKIDGLSLSLKYVDGVLVQAVTRGNGETGDDVTANAKVIKDIPQHLSGTMTIEVRGEVYMSHKTFEELNRELDENDRFSNPRNAASGSLKLRDSSEVAKRNLGFIAYRMIGQHPARTQSDVLKFLKMLGFHANSATVIQTVDELDRLIKDFTANRSKLGFDIDGLVVKIDDLKVQDETGQGNRAVNWGVAFKFPAERKPTKLLRIELTVGKTGQITPNGVLEPVTLNGAVVRHVSICNQDEIDRLGINVGDDVFVERSAEVVPKIVGLSEKRTEGVYKFPTTCPSCGGELTRDGVHYFCHNAKCPEQLVQKVIHATGKGCLDIDGCGEQTVRELVRNGVKDLADVFEIKDVGFLGQANSKKFLKGREAAKKQPLWRKIASLCIPGIGKTMSKELCIKSSDLGTMYTLTDAELAKVVGNSNAKSMRDWAQDDENLAMLQRLEDAGVEFSEDRQAAGPLTGKVFCITGTLMSGSRDQVAHKIESAGGVVKSSVGKKVDFLLQGVGGGNTKATAAAKYGTKVITEDELFKMMGAVAPTAAVLTEEPEY